ncbi:MAG TPA: hypothetical protein VGR89_12435, partial [Puia sp.]|nr:hypothetical protein [Puia sp.]
MKQPYRLWAALSILLFLTFFTHAFGQVMTGRFTSIDNNTHAYYEYLPQGYNPSDTVRYPLMVYIHGAGDLGAGTSTTLPLMLRSGPPQEINEDSFPSQVTVNGRTFGFIMIGPQWVTQPGPADVQNVINFAISKYKVDTTRIYLTGLSMGGGVTWLYAGNQAAYANRLAAIVPVCGDANPDSVRGRIIAAANLPVWATHNDQDPLVPVQWTLQQVAWINEPPAPVPPAITTIFHNNVHDAWTATYSPSLSVNNMNIYQWMLQYARLSTNANNPPVVTVGALQSISLPISTATLTGSVKDSLGTVTKHTWTFVSGPATPTIVSSTSDTTSVTGLLAPGVYIFTLSATDSRNLTVSANAQITVFAPPTGPNRLINVNLYGNNDPYGNGAWNDWNAASSLTSAKFNYSDGSPSNLSAVLSAQTAVADNGPNDVTVTMCPQKVARYASYFSGSGGRTLAINGLDSTKLYRLDLYATRNNPNQTTTFATPGTSITISTNNNTAVTATIDNLKPVNGKIVVTMTHGQYYDYLNGLTITEKTVIAPSSPPVANAGPDQSITLPLDSVTLNGTGSKGVNKIVSYQWSLLSGLGGIIESPNASQTVMSGLTAGTYVVQLKVVDDSNLVGLDTVNITVNPAPPSPPPLAHAGPDQTITLPLDSVFLDGSSSTGVNPIVGWQWTVISGPSGTFETPTASKSVLTNLSVGTYVVQLMVTDDSSRIGLDTVIVSVKPVPPPPPPTANAGPNQSVTLPANSVTLNASASSGKDSIVSYQWTVISGPAGDSLSAPDSVITSFLNLSAGAYQVVLKVTDDSSQVGLDTVTITVISPIANQPPQVKVGPNQTVNGSSTTLNSTVTDPENVISSQLWTKVSAPGQRLLHVGVIGSSTMYGTGPANIDSSLVNRIQRYYRQNDIIDTIYNLAVGGSTVYNGVTADFVSPGPYPNQYDSTANVTAALAKGIDVLIVGYPSNLYEIGQLTIPEIMAAHQNIFDAANAAGVKCYITTTQPRTSSFDSADQAQLLVIRDSLLNRFGVYCMDFMTPMVYPGTFTVLPQYSAGDGIHLNSAAHAQLANIVEATNPFRFIVNDPSIIASPSTTSTSVTGLDSGAHKYQMGAFDQYKLASSAIVTVTAGTSSPPPPVPVANAGPDQTITLPTSSATLTGSGTETGGKIVSYTWTQAAGNPATIVNPAAATTNVTNLDSAGIYTFVLTVTDSLRAKASDTANIVVNPAPQTQSKLINVAIYGFSNPYINSAWNDWNLGGSTLTSGLFKYSDGTTSAISAALSAQSAVVDNGPGYTVTMCPQQAARYPSYYSGSGGRTLTLSGLDSTKLYRIDLFATRSNPQQTTIFTVGASKVTISTNNNTATVATFDNLSPAPGGKIAITLTHGQYYDYINAFTVTEKTVVATGGAAAEVSSSDAGITPDRDSVASAGSLSGQALAIYPNPLKDGFVLHVNNASAGRMKVDI